MQDFTQFNIQVRTMINSEGKTKEEKEIIAKKGKKKKATSEESKERESNPSTTKALD